MEQIYVITNDRFKEKKDEVTLDELRERVRRIDHKAELKVEIEGVYDTSKSEPLLIAVPKEFVVQK